MKRNRPSKTARIDPMENRRDGLRFSGFAMMQVRASGGPIHAPHERVLQLLILPWKGDDESWTIYRHEAGAHKDGKIVFKKWNRKVDQERFRALGRQEAPKNWHGTVLERQFVVPGRWVRTLEQRLGLLSVPLIAGSVQPLTRDTIYKLRLWRGRQESEFSWNPRAPAAWRPLAEFFSALLDCLRQHADGKPLSSASDL